MKNRRIAIIVFAMIFWVIMNVTASAVSYDYDDLGRVTTVTYNSGKIVTYTYDDNGNITNISYEGNNTIVPAPVNLAAEEITNESVTLVWEQPESSYEIIEYQVYRNGELIETVAEMRYEDMGLTADSLYSYHIIAVNSNGVQSAISEVFNAKTRLHAFVNEDFVQVSGGGYHTIALKSDGTVWAWGNNEYGQLGNGTYDSSSVPQKVSGLTDVIEISTRGDHNLALKADGTVWSWGVNSYGQLGNGTVEMSNVPIQVGGFKDIVTVSAGHQFSVAVSSDGTVYSWGSNKNGQLGIGSSYTFFKVPQKINGLTNIIKVSAGHYHTLALDSNGTAWAWGNNSYGQLGNGATGKSLTPIKVSDDILSICAGWDNSFFAVDNTDGDCYASVLVCGYNNNGQLGTGNNSPVYNLTEVTTVNEDGVSGEYFHALRNISSNTTTLLFDNAVHMSGMNYYGQFGNGNNRYRICGFAYQFANIGDDKVQSVSAGSGHSVILAGGRIYCSGLNNHGQCGLDANAGNINVFTLIEA